MAEWNSVHRTFSWILFTHPSPRIHEKVTSVLRDAQNLPPLPTHSPHLGPLNVAFMQPSNLTINALSAPKTIRFSSLPTQMIAIARQRSRVLTTTITSILRQREIHSARIKDSLCGTMLHNFATLLTVKQYSFYLFVVGFGWLEILRHFDLISIALRLGSWGLYVFYFNIRVQILANTTSISTL